MRVPAAFAAGAGSVAILAIGWQLGAPLASATSQPTTTPTSATAATTTPSPASTASSTPAPITTSSPTPTPTAATAADGTYTGKNVSFRFGSIQTTVTITSGKIADITSTVNANDGRSQQIDNRAVPMLRDQALTKQSAKISAISGATYTSQAYLTSLQAALDQAHFTG